jgi:hypothetical protein
MLPKNLSDVWELPKVTPGEKRGLVVIIFYVKSSIILVISLLLLRCSLVGKFKSAYLFCISPPLTI